MGNHVHLFGQQEKATVAGKNQRVKIELVQANLPAAIFFTICLSLFFSGHSHADEVGIKFLRVATDHPATVAVQQTGQRTLEGSFLAVLL